jgi:translation initiation factor 2 beta subunit (eIF-2beta)/eIF-5
MIVAHIFICLSAPKEIKEKAKKRLVDETPLTPSERAAKRRRKEITDVLAYDPTEGPSYRPKTKETQIAYESLLNFIKQFVGDQSESVIMSAADEVLAILKNEEMKPADRQKEVELLLKTQMSPEVFADLIKISKAITDFVDETGGISLYLYLYLSLYLFLFLFLSLSLSLSLSFSLYCYYTQSQSIFFSFVNK